MKRALMTVLAVAAVGIATPAMAVVTVANTSGTPLANQIYGIAATGLSVTGSSPANDGIPTVTFTGNTQISVGSGFAQINDATPTTPDFYSLIINPTANFTDFKFSTMLTGEGTISIFYLLAGSGLDANNIANYTQTCATCSYTADNSNLNKLLSGGTFDGFAIKTTAPIAFFEVKQLSFNPVGAVPEPGTWAMMLVGFAGMGAAMRRSRRRRTSGTLMQVA